jgi:3-oxoacyl-[acyl-carrier protein] reductase
MDLGIAHRKAAVAAASTGLGFASAKALADEGVQVAICGRDAGRINEAAARIGHGCIPIVQDVSDAEGGADFVSAAIEALGGIDILVTNAGGPPAGNFASTPVAAYPDAINLNLMSVIGMCSVAVPVMQANGWGRVAAITSVSVRQPIPNLILSNTARAGVTGYLKTLAREVAADGVTVNSVQPGIHRTNRILTLQGDTVSGPMGEPEDFGAIVAFMCSEQARFTTGVQFHVDGGAYAALL